MRPKNFLTLKTALKTAVPKLLKAKIDSAWLDAELLLAFILKKDRSFILTHNDKTLTSEQIKHFLNLIKQRIKNVPIAYLIGEKEFYGLNFKITKDTLVPRPASEKLVDKAIETLKENPKAILIDVGTGSGCLIISVLKNLKIKIKLTVAIDISKKALTVARLNAKKHKVKVQFLQGNLLKPVLKKIKAKSRLIIIANLPYLTKQEIKKELSIQKEPRRALDGGEDGLKYYRQLVKQIKKLQDVKNISATLIAEINPWQKSKFRKIWPN